jgi:DNA-binding transcriptional LysR family regulator
MSDLERHMGTVLLNRSTRSLSVTDAGKRCYQYSLKVIQATEDAVAAALGMEPVSARSPIVIGAPVLTIDGLLAPLIARFAEEFPDIAVELSVVDNWTPAVAKDLDVCLHLGPVPEGANNFMSRPLLRVPQSLFASPAYAVSHPYSGDPQELAQLAWIGYPETRNRLTLRLSSGSESQILKITPRYRVGNMLSARQSALAGLGICCLPDFVCTDVLARSEVTCVAPEHSLDGSELSLIYKRRATPRRSAIAFIMFLSSALKNATDLG